MVEQLKAQEPEDKKQEEADDDGGEPETDCDASVLRVCCMDASSVQKENMAYVPSLKFLQC